MHQADDPLFSTFARANLSVERGEGVWLIDTEGRRYLDLTGGIAVNSLGHAHPHLAQALANQAGKLWHVSNLFEIPDQRRLGQRLVDATFADKAFFTNSGAEALECAIKTARRYHYVSGQPERFRVVTFTGAFHGRTLATIAAGGQAKYLEGFGPKVEGFDQVPFGDHDALRAAITPETAAVLVEPIQGEGGIRAVPDVCLKGLRELCDREGILLIYDEVQTGVGRTGTFFAYERSGAAPDVLASAKGIGGGFPMGVCLATAEAAKGMTPGTHGTTFGGNPLAMAVGNAVLDVVLAEGFLEEVRRTASLFRQGLASLQDRYPDMVEAVRGEGLLIGLKPTVPNGELITALREESVLAAPAGDNVVRFLPPLTITADEVREGVSRIDDALAALRAKRQGAAA
ncbi:aspartate aminotransferase family protein [Aureimonas jatrophae]|uniref:Acetylornithine aminotransferase n=1 Tax=Aureimonas jatrophae TaxID=1166073 RepID=A0A1H0L684_9HYPH|nr:aspartate aminotransferase family protein [Aureimonas jatrophae]MBB3952423.1 acetylornithine/N-succinyldiaminopimelate aminotransferase [Aureimonas jatrophae]SDO63615.1 acetylornithine aminotransferase apoenzyme [Aureimonas jatrophae]